DLLGERGAFGGRALLELGAGAAGVGLECRGRGLGVDAELLAGLGDLALEVGATLLEVVGELGAQAGVFGLELGASLLGVAGEGGGGLAGLRDFALGDDARLGDFAF